MRIKESIQKNFVARFVLLGLCIVGSFGCDKEEDPVNHPANNSIIGHWEWFLTVQPHPLTIFTPDSEGYDASIKFEPTDSVRFFRNDTLTYIFPFELTYRINNFLDPNSDSTLVLVINGGGETFFTVENDTLILDQTYVDGPRDHYKRIE